MKYYISYLFIFFIISNLFLNSIEFKARQLDILIWNIHRKESFFSRFIHFYFRIRRMYSAHFVGMCINSKYLKIDTNVRYVNVKFVNVKIYFDFLSSIVSSYHIRTAKFATAIKRLKSKFSKEFKSNFNKVNFFF